VYEHPDGGVTGEAAGRRVDCTVDALVERALDLCAGRVEELWSP
jgi:hypothetical protein